MHCPRSRLNVYMWHHDSFLPHVKAATQTHLRHMDDYGLKRAPPEMQFASALFAMWQPGYYVWSYPRPHWTRLANICYRFPWQQEEKVESCQRGANRQRFFFFFLQHQCGAFQRPARCDTQREGQICPRCPDVALSSPRGLRTWRSNTDISAAPVTGPHHPEWISFNPIKGRLASGSGIIHHSGTGGNSGVPLGRTRSL